MLVSIRFPGNLEGKAPKCACNWGKLLKGVHLKKGRVGVCQETNEIEREPLHIVGSRCKNPEAKGWPISLGKGTLGYPSDALAVKLTLSVACLEQWIDETSNRLFISIYSHQ